MSPALPRRDRVRPVIMVLTALMMAFAATVALSPPAHAGLVDDACTATESGRNGGGAGTMKITTHLKVSYYAKCDNFDQVTQGTVFYYWCTHVNSYGNLWVYGRVAGGWAMGWTSMANLATYDSAGIIDCGIPA